MEGTAVVLAPNAYRTDSAKTAHGLVRGSERYRVVAVVDPESAGEDAGQALDGRHRDIPIVATLTEALARGPDTCIVGVATKGGRLPPELRVVLLEAARAGLTIVSGLHELASDDRHIAATGVRVLDVRRPRPAAELHFWNGDIAQVRAPRLAVLGTDCALGKRTTARLLVHACAQAGLKAEMIYTGQTGWMQGGRFGFVFDSTMNDFVSGEIEHAVVACDKALSPDLIVLEGQSALRNPSGPCGSELIISAQAKGVILQHAPGRKDFKGLPGWPIPPIEEEIQLIGLYGAKVLAITLNGEKLSKDALIDEQKKLEKQLKLPVVRPVEEGADALLPVVRQYLKN